MFKMLVVAVLMALNSVAFADVIMNTCAWTEITSSGNVTGSYPSGCFVRDTESRLSTYSSQGIGSRVAQANPEGCSAGFKDLGKQLLSISHELNSSTSFVVARQCRGN